MGWNGSCGGRTGGPGDWPETGEICCVPKRTGVTWELGGSKGVECKGRVTAKGSHKGWPEIYLAESHLGLGSPKPHPQTEIERVLGLSEMASKA